MATTIRGSDNFDTAPDGLGKVVQIQQTELVSTAYIQQITSTTYVPITGFEVTITPKFDNSEILINVCLNSGNTATGWEAFGLFKDGTYIKGSARFNGSQYIIGSNQLFYVIDNSNITAGTPITYSIQAAAPEGNHTLNIHWNNGSGLHHTSTITAMEIAQ